MWKLQKNNEKITNCWYTVKKKTVTKECEIYCGVIEETEVRWKWTNQT